MAFDNRYSADSITIAVPSQNQDDGAAVVEVLNDILVNESRGRSLTGTLRTYGKRAVVPLAGADPFEVCDVLRWAGTTADPRPELAFYSGTNQTLDPGTPPFEADSIAGIGRDVGHLAAQGHPASIGRDVGHLAAPGHPASIGRDVGHLAPGGHSHSMGCDVGHGLVCAEIRPDFTGPDLSAWKPLPPHLRRPVIALLDSGVGPHPSLPLDDADDPFRPAHDWSSPLPDMDPAAPKAGHGTFNAGLIRINAPTARILSLRVMDGDGRVLESTVVDALLWLEKYREQNPVDVILMPFGRSPGNETDDADALAEFHAPIERLAQAGVAIVASAGNDHQSAGIHPAAFDDVIAVGAGFGDYHAHFSNCGDWVDRYREGVDVLSILPGDLVLNGRWAYWSGTSFSAAVVAADLARPHAA